MYGVGDHVAHHARRNHRAITLRIGHMTPDDEVTLMNSCSIENFRRIDDTYSEYDLIVNVNQLQADVRHKQAPGKLEDRLHGASRAKETSPYKHELGKYEAELGDRLHGAGRAKEASPYKHEFHKYEAELECLLAEMRKERARLNVVDYREDAILKRRHGILSGDYELPSEQTSVERRRYMLSDDYERPNEHAILKCRPGMLSGDYEHPSEQARVENRPGMLPGDYERLSEQTSVERGPGMLSGDYERPNEHAILKCGPGMLSGDYERPSEQARVEAVVARIDNVEAECRTITIKGGALDKRIDVLQDQALREDYKWRQLKKKESELCKHLERLQKSS